MSSATENAVTKTSRTFVDQVIDLNETNVGEGLVSQEMYESVIENVKSVLIKMSGSSV